MSLTFNIKGYPSKDSAKKIFFKTLVKVLFFPQQMKSDWELAHSLSFTTVYTHKLRYI